MGGLGIGLDDFYSIEVRDQNKVHPIAIFTFVPYLCLRGNNALEPTKRGSADIQRARSDNDARAHSSHSRHTDTSAYA